MRLEPIKEIVWPGAVIAFMVGVGHVFFRGLDDRMVWTKSFRRSQDWFHVAVLGGGLYGVSESRSTQAKEASVAAVYADLPLLGESVAATVFEGVLKRRAGGGGGGRLLTAAESRKLLAAAGGGRVVSPAQVYEEEITA